MENNWMVLTQQKNQIAKVMEAGQAGIGYGLSLSEEEAKLIVEARTHALGQERRVEFGEGIAPRIIYEFCDSDFISQDEYALTIIRLQDIFYLYKNETQAGPDIHRGGGRGCRQTRDILAETRRQVRFRSSNNDVSSPYGFKNTEAKNTPPSYLKSAIPWYWPAIFFMDTVPVPGLPCLEERRLPSLVDGACLLELSTVMEMARSPATLAWMRIKGDPSGIRRQASRAFSRRLPNRIQISGSSTHSLAGSWMQESKRIWFSWAISA